MIKRRSGAVALLLWLLSVALALGAFITLGGELSQHLLASTFTTVGAVLAWRRPANLVGWLLALFGLAVGLTGATFSYALRGLVEAPGSLPAATSVAWLNGWAWGLVFGALSSLFLLFPNGRLPSPRWRVVLWAQWALVAFFSIAGGFFSDSLSTFQRGQHPNPYVIVPLPDVYSWTPTLMLPLVAAALSLLVRSWRARGAERQQLKWVGSAVALFTLTGLANVSRNAFVEFGLLEQNTFVRDASNVTFYFSFLSLPLAIGVAVLRYRLYDIDLLINRTLVYGALTAALAATYFGAVALLQAALRPLTGESEFAVAGSTLLVVALFAPLRRRIQAAVDRRFYRSRYDAARILDAFGARLRDEVDLDAVRADLLDVVHDTVRPAHASVWLRKSSR